MSNKISCWGKSQTWYPTKICTPKTLEELRETLREAKEANLTVHALGSAHSVNDISATKGCTIQTDKLCRVLSVDKKAMTVRAEGGIKIHDLLDALIKEELTLPNQGYIIDQALSGAIGTSTHGSGETGSLSSFVLEIELIDANGKLHVLDPANTPELFSSACVHLGCLGFIYAVTIQCVPLFKLELSKVIEPLDNILENLDELRMTHPFFQFILDPYSDNALVWKYQKTDKPIQHYLKYQFKRMLVKGLSWISFDALPPFSPIFPLGIKLFMSVSTIKSYVNYAPRLLSPSDEGHYIEIEVGVPYEQFKDGLKDVRQIIDRYALAGVRIVSIIFIRFVEADNQGYMSTAYKRKTAYISLIAIRRPGYDNLFKEVEEALQKYQGRPHWGKVNFLTKEDVIELYGESYHRFVEAKRVLDPENRFSNSFSKRLFGETK